jgi:hypothetical protein
MYRFRGRYRARGMLSLVVPRPGRESNSRLGRSADRASTDQLRLPGEGETEEGERSFGERARHDPVGTRDRPRSARARRRYPESPARALSRRAASHPCACALRAREGPNRRCSVTSRRVQRPQTSRVRTAIATGTTTSGTRRWLRASPGTQRGNAGTGLMSAAFLEVRDGLGR